MAVQEVYRMILVNITKLNKNDKTISFKISIFRKLSHTLTLDFQSRPSFLPRCCLTTSAEACAVVANAHL